MNIHKLKNKNNLVKDLLFITIVLFIPIFISNILYKNTSIDGFNIISVVSVTAFIQFWLWIIFILGMLFTILVYKKNQNQILFYSLTLILVLILTSNIASLALSLKGTPMPASDIRGDLGVLVKLAKEASEKVWISNTSYPPLYFILIGNFSSLFGVHVLEVFKISEFILPSLLAILLFFIWRKIIPEALSLIVVIFSCLSFINWKNFGLYLLFALMILVFNRIKENINSYQVKDKIYDYFYGFTIGLLAIWYYGNFWWTLLNLAFLILVSWFSKNRYYYLSRQINYYIGFGVVFIPIYFEFYLIFDLIYILLFCIVLILLNEITEKIHNLNLLKIYIFGILVPTLIFYVFFSFNTGDSWFEGVEVNPATLYLDKFQDSYTLLLITLVLFISFFVLKNSWFRTVFYFTFGTIISSTLGMYYLASNMFRLNQVNLWPRAKEIQYYGFKILLVLLFSSFIFAIIEIIKKYNSEQYKLMNKYKLEIIFFGIFVLFLSISYTLSSNTMESMPMNTFNGAWYAHQACSNPHVDPMLAKTFEEQPDVEKYLREKCWGIDWPLVNKN